MSKRRRHGDPWEYLELGKQLEKLGNYRGAYNAYSAAISFGDIAEAYLHRGRLLELRSRTLALAMADYRIVIAKKPQLLLTSIKEEES